MVLIDLLIRETWLGIRKNLILSLKSLNVSESEAYVLLAIPKAGIESTKIPAKLGLAIGSATRTLNKLESRRFVYKENDIVDKRITKYFLTGLGLEARLKVKSVVISYRSHIDKSIGEDKIRQIAESLNMINSLNKELHSNLNKDNI